MSISSEVIWRTNRGVSAWLPEPLILNGFGLVSVGMPENDVERPLGRLNSLVANGPSYLAVPALSRNPTFSVPECQEA
jgi:hypothetical protein